MVVNIVKSNILCVDKVLLVLLFHNFLRHILSSQEMMTRENIMCS